MKVYFIYSFKNENKGTRKFRSPYRLDIIL
nr:MAG TPA: hypothetical protein [Caudoviricetes sp.]